MSSTTSTASPPVKLAVVARQQPLLATRITTEGDLTLVDGRVCHVTPGMWSIARGKHLLDVIVDAALRTTYQVIEPAALTLPARACDAIEETAGLGSTATPDALVAAVDRLARIEIGTIKIPFTPGQLEEIAHRAKKRGQTVQQALQAVIDRIREELFWRS